MCILIINSIIFTPALLKILRVKDMHRKVHNKEVLQVKKTRRSVWIYNLSHATSSLLTVRTQDAFMKREGGGG